MPRCKTDLLITIGLQPCALRVLCVSMKKRLTPRAQSPQRKNISKISRPVAMRLVQRVIHGQSILRSGYIPMIHDLK
jgi:hypothetical protein